MSKLIRLILFVFLLFAAFPVNAQQRAETRIQIEWYLSDPLNAVCVMQNSRGETVREAGATLASFDKNRAGSLFFVVICVPNLAETGKLYGARIEIPGFSEAIIVRRLDDGGVEIMETVSVVYTYDEALKDILAAVTFRIR